MSKLAYFINSISNWKTLVGILMVYLLFALVLLPNAEEKINRLAGKEIGPIDLTFGFNPARILQMVEDYGQEGREYYSEVEMTIDLAYPIVYAFMLAIILTILYRRLLLAPVRYLNLLPFVALFFDYLENLTIVSLLTHYPEQSMTMATLCEIFKLLKWIAFVLIMFLGIFGLIKLLIRR